MNQDTLIDMFDHVINPGDSFMRLTPQYSGRDTRRFYFYAGRAGDGKVYINEFDGKPKSIKEPRHEELLFLTEEMKASIGYDDTLSVDAVKQFVQSHDARIAAKEQKTNDMTNI